MEYINKFDILAKVAEDSDRFTNETKTITDREVIVNGKYAVMYSCDFLVENHSSEGTTDEYGNKEYFTDGSCEKEFTDICCFDLSSDDDSCILTEQQRKELLKSLNNEL
jgi:hypothetical protein